MDFEIGDLVVYTGNFTTSLIGKKGIVSDVNELDNIKVVWSDVDIVNPYGVFPENLTLVKEKENKMKKFWMVTGERNSPAVRHDSYDKAEREAKRLAAANPGKEFFVLEATAGFQLPQSVQKIL